MYTTTRSSLGAENHVDLVLNVEDFDVESKFERYECGQGDGRAAPVSRLLEVSVLQVPGLLGEVALLACPANQSIVIAGGHGPWRSRLWLLERSQ